MRQRSAWIAVTFSGMGLLAAWFTFRSILGGNELGGGVAVVWTLVFIFGGFTALVVGLLILPARSSIKTLHQLRARFPGAVVERIAGSPDMRIGINMALERPVYPLSTRYQVLVVRGSDVEFWATAGTEPLLRLGSERIDDVSVRNVTNSDNVTLATVFIDTRSRNGRRISLPLLIMRNSGTGIFPDDRAAGMRVANAIAAARGNASATGSSAAV